MPAGRPAGSSNQKSIAIKTMIINALSKAGGEDYLLQQSRENPTAFMTLIGKVLPLALDPGDGKLTISWEK